MAATGPYPYERAISALRDGIGGLARVAVLCSIPPGPTPVRIPELRLGRGGPASRPLPRICMTVSHPATPESTRSPTPAAAAGRLVARPMAFADVPRSAWDRLCAASAAATPFSRWTTHRAWWDAYGSTAHEQYLVCVASDMGTDTAAERAADTGTTSGADGHAADSESSPSSSAETIRAIVPLMHRHEVEPQDEVTATGLRRRAGPRGTAVPADAKAVFFGASYHADYATLLCAPDDMDAAAAAVVEALGRGPDPGHGSQDWDVVDLRRLRDHDPALPALEGAFRAAADLQGWTVTREQEDVCPVLRMGGSDWEAYLGTLDKKSRHEIRRKWRRAEAVGPLTFRDLEPSAVSVEAFIDLHQARWGAEGLFPPTAGGDRSRRFLHRLAELEAAEGEGRQLQLGQVEVDGRVIFSTVGFDDGRTCYFYNAGLDPDARELSPGVVGTAAYLRDRLEAGRDRFDFLRGDEPYKYEWGAHDEPIHRLLVTRVQG